MSVDDDFPRVVALFDYVARSEKELTFRAGDVLVVTDMLSDDWLQGEYQGHAGLIAASYVKHAPDWRSLVSHVSQAPSPQLTRKKPHSVHGAHSSFTGNNNALANPSPAHTPETQRKAMASVHGIGMPGLTGQAPLDREFGVGVDTEELISPKKLPRGPDRPDLAKALNVRNQAARVGGPQKPTNANPLQMHLKQLQAKKAQANRFVNKGEAELKERLKMQKHALEDRERQGEETELEKRMAALARTHR